MATKRRAAKSRAKTSAAPVLRGSHADRTVAMRGLATELMFSGNRPRAEAAMKLLYRYKVFMTGYLVTKIHDET